MQSLKPDERPIFQAQYEDSKKSVLAGVLLAFFFGQWGAHWFYLGKQNRGLTYLFITLVSLPLMLVVIGFLSFAAICIVALVDACMMGDHVKKVNLENGRQIFNAIVGTRAEYRNPPDSLPPAATPDQPQPPPPPPSPPKYRYGQPPQS